MLFAPKTVLSVLLSLGALASALPLSVNLPKDLSSKDARHSEHGIVSPPSHHPGRGITSPPAAAGSHDKRLDVVVDAGIQLDVELKRRDGVLDGVKADEPTHLTRVEKAGQVGARHSGRGIVSPPASAGTKDKRHGSLVNIENNIKDNEVEVEH